MGGKLEEKLMINYLYCYRRSSPEIEQNSTGGFADNYNNNNNEEWVDIDSDYEAASNSNNFTRAVSFRR